MAVGTKDLLRQGCSAPLGCVEGGACHVTAVFSRFFSALSQSFLPACPAACQAGSPADRSIEQHTCHHSLIGPELQLCICVCRPLQFAVQVHSQVFVGLHHLSSWTLSFKNIWRGLAIWSTQTSAAEDRHHLGQPPSLRLATEVKHQLISKPNSAQLIQISYTAHYLGYCSYCLSM